DHAVEGAGWIARLGKGQMPTTRRLQPRNESKQSALPAPTRPHQANELTRPNLKVQRPQCVNLTPGGAGKCLPERPALNNHLRAVHHALSSRPEIEGSIRIEVETTPPAQP